MGLLSQIQLLINEHGSSLILKERLLLLQDQLCDVLNENRDLNEELSKVVRKCHKLQKELEAKTTAEEYVEYRGALFKRRASGAYDPTVYCPVCHVPLGSMEGFFPYSCLRCDIRLDFNGSQLQDVLKELSELED